MEAQLQPARDRFTALDEEDQTAFRDRGGGSGRSLVVSQKSIGIA